MEERAVVQEATPTAGPQSAARALWKVRATAWAQAVLLAALALTLNLAGNGRTGLWDRDEPRYAESVREMRHRGDWMFPTFNGEPRYHKPILVYWLMGMGTALGGDNPFGARLVSALAGAATVLGTWALGRKMLGPRGGWLAALVLVTAPIMVAESKLATTDAILTLWLLGCQACLWVLGQRPSRLAAGAFWVFLSLAALTKGPVGPALIAASSLLAWWWGWRAAAWKRLHWRGGLIGFVLLTVPWPVAMTIVSRGEFLRFAVGNQVVHRLASDMETHGGFPGYYPVVATLVFYPWSALVPAAVAGLWALRKSQPAIGLLLGWSIGPLVLLECVRTKLIHYYLPAFPAWALLVAWLVLALAAEGVNIRRWRLGRSALALLVGIGLMGTVLLATCATRAPENLRLPMILVAGVMVAGTLAGHALFQQAASEKAVHALAVTWALVLLAFGGWLIPALEPYRTSRKIGEKLAALSAKMGLEPVLLEYREPGVIYAVGHPVATASDRDAFYRHLRDGRSVLTVALAEQFEVMRNHFGLSVTPVDQVEGLVLNKGKRQTFQIAVVGEPNLEPALESSRSASTVSGSRPKQTLIK
jgi:4-amino-4-deoxy-L-arabinose transferase-like glycosyltransferase